MKFKNIHQLYVWAFQHKLLSRLIALAMVHLYSSYITTATSGWTTNIIYDARKYIHLAYNYVIVWVHVCVAIHNKCMHMKHINCIQICTCIRISGGYSVWYSVPCPVYKQHTQYWSYFHMLSGFMRSRHKYICFPTHAIVVIWKLKCPPTSNQKLFIELLVEIFRRDS